MALPATQRTLWKILLILLLALILGRFGVVGIPKILNNHISSDGDESAYLSLSLALLESGALSDGTRPPLYALLLSPWAEREWAYFTTAKLVTLGLGALTVLAVFAAGVRLFSWEAALLAAFLLAANKEFHVRASTVYADTLLALVLVGSWYYLIKSLTGWRYCILAGIFVGLSFLTKGSAPVLLAAWGLTALLVLRRDIIRRKGLLLVPLFFVLTSLPLLIFNAREFGNPTYNFATQHIMWMDRLAEINTADPAELPTFSTYTASHTPADMAARVQKGLRRLNPVVARSVIPSRDFEPAWLGPALGLLVLAVLGYLLLFERKALRRYLVQRQAVLWFTFFLCALFYLFFTWYVAGSSAETRFITPLLGPLYLVFADGVVSPGRGLWRRLAGPADRLQASPERRPWPAAYAFRLALGLVIAWSVWWLVDTSRQAAWALEIDPYEADRSANAEEEQIVQWLSRDRPDRAALAAFGPSKSLPLWKIPANFTMERLPVEITTWAAMQRYVEEQRPDYIIIDDDTARRRRQALAGHFQRKDGLVTFEAVPPGWVLDFVYPGLPCRWCIFSPAEPVEPLARLAGGIELVSYRLVNDSPPAKAAGLDSPRFSLTTPENRASLRVVITWRAEDRPAKDYTVFVHLTAPDGYVVTQQDRPPFGGAYPTSRWQPGETVADRYELPLAGVGPGDYLLLAGMYHPETGERLPVVSGPTGPVPDSVLLGPLLFE